LIRVATFVPPKSDKLTLHRAGLFALATINDTSEKLLTYSDEGQPRFERSYVSIGHSAECAVAAISNERVGIDVEPVDREIPGTLQGYVTSSVERKLLRDTPYPVASWVIKEAVLKLRGTGVTAPPRQLVTIEQVVEPALIRCRDAHGEVYVTVRVHNQYVVAVAHEKRSLSVELYSYNNL
jgi:phosphopantetheinyl transferase